MVRQRDIDCRNCAHLAMDLQLLQSRHGAGGGGGLLTLYQNAPGVVGSLEAAVEGGLGV